MKNRKKFGTAAAWVCGVLLLTVLLRLLNIYYSYIYFNVAYSDMYVKAVDIVHGVLLLASWGFSLSLIVYAGRRQSTGESLRAAGAFSAVVFADRLFCIIYDLASSNIAIKDKSTLTTAAVWLSVDFLYFAVTYFASAFITRAAVKRYREKKRGVSFCGCLAASASVLTLLKLISQLAVCIGFIAEYDDLTATEYAQMAGDILLVVIKYGFGVFAFSLAGYLILNKIAREEKNGVNNENNEKDRDKPEKV